ncbi:26S proteasome non-ATPase regulatory subunit 13 [Pelomyxa schiedti]|nr:26S proteasome non-ATPase regulatory subunit 13 [Pelomyxa schiedti]
MSAKVRTFLEHQMNTCTRHAGDYSTMASLYERRNWHQLTDYLEMFMKKDDHAQNELIELYQNFIRDFETKLNLLTLTKLAKRIATQYSVADGITFFTDFINKIKADKGAHIFVTAILGLLFLRVPEPQNILKARDYMEHAQEELEGVAGLDPVVCAEFYKLCTEFSKIKGDQEQFFAMGMQFLHFADLHEYTTEVQTGLALDMALCALIHPNIYNFGEFMAHPISKRLLETSSLSWIHTLLTAFNSGDMAAFEAVLASDVQRNEQLARNVAAMRQKISILALMQLVFKRPAQDHCLSFADIATATARNVDEVETLVMKALSLGLVKGTIDEVAQQVEISWIKPRVLDSAQIDTLIARLVEWKKTIGQTLVFVENETTEFHAKNF